MEEFKKSFEYWKTQEVEEVFGIEPAKDNTLLREWLAAKCEISDNEQERLEYLRQRLEDKVEFWNEAAIKFYFIGPLMSIINYDNGKYNSFLEHTLKLRINDEITISGNIDFLIATGKQIPRSPFFTLHEYKPEPNTSIDPKGQLLVGMVAAQRQNVKKQINIPLFGVYVVGRLWFFVTLTGDGYTTSKAYDATQEDIFEIFCVLKKVKHYINDALAVTKN